LSFPLYIFIIVYLPKKVNKKKQKKRKKMIFILFKLFPENSINTKGDITTMKNQSKFFQFFETKRLKLSIAIFFGTVGIISNYSAIRYYLLQTRMDLIQSETTLTIYALGISLALDIAIIVFHLMRTYALMWGSVILAFLISTTANTNSFLVCAGACKQPIDDPGTMLAFSQALIMSVLPIAIIVYLTELAVQQYDREIKNINETYKNSWHDIKLD
jgi:ABC-type multidrug transport system fused ATPase/permease subunit